MSDINDKIMRKGWLEPDREVQRYGPGRKPKTPNRQIESIMRFRYGFTLKVRVWTTATDVDEAVRHVPIPIPPNLDMKGVAEYVAEWPYVAAVEVTDYDGKGVIIYPDWN